MSESNKFHVSEQQALLGKADRDSIHRFLFDHKPIQGLWLNVENTVTEAIKHQPHYPVSVRKLLGELVIVSSIFRHYIKTEGTIYVQIQSEDSVLNAISVIVDANSVRCRALLDEDAPQIPDNAQLEDLINVDANLIVSIFEPGQKPYQSIIQVNLNSIEQSITDFFNQSVQSLAFLKLASTQTEDDQVESCGLFMQYIPDDSGTKEDFQDAVKIAQTLTDEELLKLSAFDCMYRLYNQEDVKMTFEKKLRFMCNCSKEVMIDALATLSPEDFAELFAENGFVEMTCKGCNASFEITEEEAKKALSKESDCSLYKYDKKQ